MYFEDRIRDETPEVQRCAIAYAHLQGWIRRDELHDILEIARRDARIFDLEREVAALKSYSRKGNMTDLERELLTQVKELESKLKKSSNYEVNIKRIAEAAKDLRDIVDAMAKRNGWDDANTPPQKDNQVTDEMVDAAARAMFSYLSKTPFHSFYGEGRWAYMRIARIALDAGYAARNEHYSADELTPNGMKRILEAEFARNEAP